MATCEVCGTEFDERGVQIVVPGIAKSFDRVECAVRGRALSGGPATPMFTPRHAMFVEVTRRAEPRSYGLPGLPAGLAAALGGTRARVALGGASAAVALLVATTAHLSLRSGGTSDEQARSSVLPSPPRYGDDKRPRARVVETRAAAGAGTSLAAITTRRAWTYAPFGEQHVEHGAFHLVVHQPHPTEQLTVVKARTATKKPKATRHSPKASRLPPARTRQSVSTRPGWGHGDKNHAHSGPHKHSSTAKAGKAHGRAHR